MVLGLAGHQLHAGGPGWRNSHTVGGALVTVWLPILVCMYAHTCRHIRAEKGRQMVARTPPTVWLVLRPGLAGCGWCPAKYRAASSIHKRLSKHRHDSKNVCFCSCATKHYLPHLMFTICYKNTWEAIIDCFCDCTTDNPLS